MKTVIIVLSIFVSGCMGLNIGGTTAYNMVTSESESVQPDRPFPTTPEVIGLPPAYGGVITIPLGFFIEYGTFPAMLPLGFLGGSIVGLFSIPAARRKQKARNPETSVEELRTLAKDSNSEVRKEVAINPKAPLDLLKKLATNDEPNVRAYASYALGGRSKDSKEAIPILVKNLNDSNNEVQYGAVKAISSMGVYAKKAIPALTKHLFHPKVEIRATCAEALGNMGYHSKSSLPKLEKLSADKSDTVRKEAKKAIDKINGRGFEEAINGIAH